ncbi:4'-phosphopantetheinyl transferase family protein [Paracoccus alkanivorans]|uniref:4'-phosphopantetheinyl transferase family protein n=1 Tax=Paracoccus alkanivorans TaxID=2116655 RepID=UPI001407A33F|nr:4'-phosphopantetheinyl transferase superfamily protein [Paracoccus alkanivorans]
MSGTPTDVLARAASDLPLPPGGALAFAPVGDAAAVELPEPIRRCAQRRQATFAAGRIAAQEALCKAGFRGAAALGIGDDGLPDWPPGWLGSISHSDDTAAALVAPVGCARLLGLDLERIVTAEIAVQIAPEIMPGQPVGHSGLLLEHEVTCAFSAKEALYKALYPLTRQFRDFSAAHIGWQKDGAAAPVRVMLTLTEDWGAGWATGTVFEALQRTAAGHVATILWR